MEHDSEHAAKAFVLEGDSSIGEQDAVEMAKLGKRQQLRRNFEFWSILGFSCVTMVTWEGLMSTFVYGLENGGPAGLVIGFIIVWVGYAFCVASLAEMMSMWPTSGGQYHWTYTLAPPRLAKFLSYIVGWQSVVAWQAATASACYFAATMLQGLLVLNSPDYDYHRWHGTLLMYAIILFSLLVSAVGTKILPILDRVALLLHLAGFVVFVVVIAVLSPSKSSAHHVFDVWYNAGYPTQGVSFLVGLQGLVFAWLGADGAIHMAEEIRNASTVLPWSLMMSILINGSLGFGILLLVLFCGGNLKAALSSPTGYPIEAILTFATRSTAGGTGLTSIILAMFFIATMTVFTAASRELWAFARDKGVPGWGRLSNVHERYKLPLFSIFATLAITVLLALVNIGSATAFNALVSLTVSGYVGSYLIPLSLVLYRRIQAARGKGRELPWGPWRMGRWGILVNAIGLAWGIVIFFWSFWPIVPLPYLTVATMNWSSLAWGAITVLAMAFWFVHGKRNYHGPVRDASDGDIEPVLAWNVTQSEIKDECRDS